MKIRKILALLMVCIMMFSLCAIMPASAAASPADSIFLAYQPENHPDWWAPPTVEGADGYLTINSTYATATRQAVDMESKKVVINSLLGSFYPHITLRVTFGPEALTGERTFNEEAGFVGLRFQQLDTTGDGVPDVVRVDYRDVVGPEGDVYGVHHFNLPHTDTYEIEFFKKGQIDPDSGINQYKYFCRVNTVYFTGDAESWIGKYMESEYFNKSYVSFSTTNYVQFNANIVESDGFVSANGSSGVHSAPDTEDGYQSFRLVGDHPNHSNGLEIASPRAYDLTQKALSLRPSWYTVDGAHDWFASTVIINLSNTGILSDGAHVCDENTLSILFSPTHNDNSKKLMSFVHVDRCCWDAFEYSITYTDKPVFEVQNAEEYNISFVNVGTNKWAMVVNDQYVMNDYINAFMNSGAGKEAYISMSAYQEVPLLKAKMIDKKIADWAGDNNNGMMKSYTNEDGTKSYEVDWHGTVATTEKHNLFDTVFELSNREIVATYGNIDMLMIGFTNEYGVSTTRADNPAEGKLMFDMQFNDRDGDGIADDVGFHQAAGNIITGYFPIADSYKFNFAKEADGYYLYINDIKISTPSITAFCEANYAEAAYVSFAPYISRVKLGLDIKNVTTEHNFAASEDYDIADATFKNLGANTTVESFKNTIGVADGYSVKVVTADGVERDNAANVASTDKIKVYYKAREILSYNIVVLADTNGDGAINSEDLINFRKALFGNSVEGIVTDALNAKYDAEFNILDLIAAKKAALQA